MIKVKVTDKDGLDNLMSSEEYKELIGK